MYFLPLQTALLIVFYFFISIYFVKRVFAVVFTDFMF